jgi:hypothetical protein
MLFSYYILSSGIEEGSGTFENKSIRGFSGTALQAPKLLEIVFQLRPYLKYALFRQPVPSINKMHVP